MVNTDHDPVESVSTVSLPGGVAAVVGIGPVVDALRSFGAASSSQFGWTTPDSQGCS